MSITKGEDERRDQQVVGDFRDGQAYAVGTMPGQEGLAVKAPADVAALAANVIAMTTRSSAMMLIRCPLFIWLPSGARRWAGGSLLRSALSLDSFDRRIPVA